MSAATVIDVQPDPHGHVWDLDWIDVEGDGWRCALCWTPSYREADAGRQCRKADRLPVLRAYSGVTL